MEIIASVAAKGHQVRFYNAGAATLADCTIRRAGPARLGNREGLIIDVDFSLPSERIVRSLNQLIEWRGKPRVIRCDNGPEYISETTKTWAAKHGIEIAFIQPGQPQQNAYVERYDRTVRYDWLAHHLFDSLDEIQDFATRWLWTYNHDRPHMALGGITPIQKLALAA